MENPQPRPSKVPEVLRTFPPNTPYTAENWVELYHGKLPNYNESVFNGYMDGLDHILPVLDKITAVENFDEMKKELLAFNKQQKDFLADLDEKWINNPNSLKEYDLPHPILGEMSASLRITRTKVPNPARKFPAFTPYSAENWVEHYHTQCRSGTTHMMLFGYKECLECLLPVLDKCTTAESLGEMKAKVRALTTQQRAFLANMDVEWGYNLNCEEEYGLRLY